MATAPVLSVERCRDKCHLWAACRCVRLPSWLATKPYASVKSLHGSRMLLHGLAKANRDQGGGPSCVCHSHLRSGL